MPEKHVISDIFVIPLLFTLALNFENVINFDCVPLSVIVDVFLDQFVNLVLLFKRCNLSFEFLVVLVYLILIIVELLQHIVRDFKIRESFEHFKFFSDVLVCLEYMVLHFSSAEIMRNSGEKF